jgi:2-methylcitrate dehydratase
MDKTVEQLVQFTTEFQVEHLSPAARAAAKQRIVDTIGCAIGGYSAPPAQAARAVAYSIDGDRGARIWGSLLRTSPYEAAFANGVAARYLDFNDAYRGAVDVGHPADNIPALMAVAEQAGASGASLVEGIAIAYQIQIALAESVPLNDRGWDQPTAVVISSALGAGKILGLHDEQLAHAVSLAIVPNMAMHQTRCGELSWWKGCAAPMGARQGIFAAFLAGAGMEGPYDPFEGINGFWAQFGSRHELPALASANGTWAIQQSNIKTWPVRDSCQIGIDAAIELRGEGLDASQVAELFVETYKSSYRWAVRDRELWAPQTRETADHSLPFSIAVGLIDGTVTPETFENRRFLDANVLDLIDRMKIEVNDEFSAQTPGIKNCRVTARLTDGREAVAHIVLTQEQIEAGRSDQEVSDKFLQLAARAMAPEQAETILSRVWSITEAEDVGAVIGNLQY